MKGERTFSLFLTTSLILSLLASMITSFTPITGANDVDVASAVEGGRLEDFVRPVIYHDNRIDKDLNAVQDRLDALISQKLIDETTMVPVVVTFYNPVTNQHLNYFTQLGGQINHVYRYVTYGFAGAIPVKNILLFANIMRDDLVLIEYDQPLHYHLDVSAPLIQARPIVWDTYGYRGSTNQSIAILDTGIDDTHLDLGPYQDLNFSKKIVGWYDATPDNTLTPEDEGEHGTHVAGIAAGTGAANTLQGAGNVQNTFTYVLPPVGYGYVDYIDVKNPGFIQLSCRWSGANTVLLRLYNPGGVNVMEKSGSTSPLSLKYNTALSSYPTGRYEVLVGNMAGPQGVPFSTVETYPYQGLGDSHNLFTGVAPDSRLVGVKVFDNTGSGELSTLLGAMDWVIQNRETYHIVVASMSLSLIDGAIDSTLDQKADTLVENGIVTTVSAGNDYPTYTIGSPGTAAYVITVAATNDKNGITDYSSNGDPLKNEYGLIKPDLAAPGGTFDPARGNKIISVDSNDGDGPYTGFADQNSNDYQQMAGTSMSAPHVAGLSALVIQALGDWNWTQEEALKVKMLVCMTAFETQSGEGGNVPPLNRGDKDDKEGYGRVSADAAIEAATMNYTVGDVANGFFGSDPWDKKVWARQVYLREGATYKFNLSIPAGSDYDLYLYSGTPDVYGQPVILAKSVNSSLGIGEVVEYTVNASSTYYLVVKWVSGTDSFTLESEFTIDHDVAVLDVVSSHNSVYEGEVVNVTVTVKNQGLHPESFNVTAFYGNETIDMQSVLDLEVDAVLELVFVWNTSDVVSYGNHTIRAEVEKVSPEYDTSNNLFVDGEVQVKKLGDVNGDGIVDIFDIGTVSAHWYPGPPVGPLGYDSSVDLNKDGAIDIFDIGIVSAHWG